MALSSLDLKDAAILGELGNTRTYNQYAQLYRNLVQGDCPFCNLENLKHSPIIRKGKWIVKHSDMPYSNCEHHLLVVYYGRHVIDWGALNRDDYADYMEIINEAEKMFDIEGCAVVSRRGAIRRHAGTLMHLHSHIMVVRLDKDGLPVGVLRAYFAKSRKELEHCKKVVELFERVRTGNITGVRRGYIVCDTEGQYLNPNKEWEKCDIPINATLLNIPLDQIKVMTGKNIRYYEAMTSTETGTVLIDGPFELI